MRIHYLVADFGRRVRSPISGTLGGECIEVKPSNGVTLYRDDSDPHTLVAEHKGKVYHYPWSQVQMAVAAPKPEQAQAKKA